MYNVKIFSDDWVKKSDICQSDYQASFSIKLLITDE